MSYPFSETYIADLEAHNDKLQSELEALKSAVKWLSLFCLDEHPKGFCEMAIREWGEVDKSHAQTLLRVIQEGEK